MLKVAFLGAAGTVTGSRYLLSAERDRVLVDCGLFQGLKQLRLLNWQPFPVPPQELAGIVLTHAHLDHSGYLPVLVRDGFRGPVYATPATIDLCGILLPDSGYLQEEEAERANRYGYSKHHPALPLYTRKEAEQSLDLMVSPPDNRQTLGDFEFQFRRAGHILGASTVSVNHGGATVVFSGDLGRPSDPLMLAPEPVPSADYLIVESTYGDRAHGQDDVQTALGSVVRRTAARSGVIVIPAFAVGRAQLVLYHLHMLRQRGEIPGIPIFLDSPMAADVTRLFAAHASEHRLTPAEYSAVCQSAEITNSVEESKAIGRRNGPMIVISASGMATGGRVLFHLERFATDRRNTIVLAGHQAAGTRGDALMHGATELKIHGRFVPIHAEVVALQGLSAHADATETMAWLKGFERAPRTTFVTHGEPGAADMLRHRIEEELGWTVHVPERGEEVQLT